MIVPAGKCRQQVSQDGFKNSSIWNTNFLDKIAITGTPDVEELGGESDEQGGGGNQSALQDAMNQSSRPGMRPNATSAAEPVGQPSGGMDTQQPQPQGGQNQQQQHPQARFDQFTGEPISGNKVDFATVANAAKQFIEQNFGDFFELSAQKKEANGGFTLTFGPTHVGPAVSKR